MDDEFDAAESAAAPLAKPLSVGEAENIAVCIRVRPLNEREMRSRDCNVLRTLDAHNAISITDVDGAPLAGKHNVFQYDHIFDETRSTRFMYRHVAQRIGSGCCAVDASNAAAAAPDDADAHDTDAGLLQLAVEDIFAYIERCSDRDFLLRVSFVEIYNEVVRDLLAVSDRGGGGGGGLKMREDPRKGVYVECKEEIITSYQDILGLLALGNQRRTVGQTAMNERSSRSHSIFRIVVESKQRAAAAKDESDDDDDDDDGDDNASPGASAPFRDSKLTRLLQTSLAGNTRTLIVCCVTPSDRFLDETKSTLQFAARAKKIQTAACVNEVLDDQAQLQRVQRELRELKQRFANSAAVDALRAENAELQQEMTRRQHEHARLMRLILTSTTRARAGSDGKRPPRGKRSRETWCPGDFAAQHVLLPPPLSPNRQPRKRRSNSDTHAKENVGPLNLQSATMDGAADDDGDGSDGSDDSTSPALDRGLCATLLHVFELAVQSHRGEASAARALEDAVAHVHARCLPTDADRARLAETLQELAALADTGADAELVRGQNELLTMEVEELHRRMGRLGGPEAVERLRMQAAEAQQAQHAAEEAVAALKVQLEALRADAAAEQQGLAVQLATARRDMVLMQETHAAETQQLAAERAGLHDAMAALEQQLQQTATYHADLDAQVQFLAEEKRALAETVAALESERGEHQQSHPASTSAQDGDGDAALAGELQKLLQDSAKLQFELEAATTERDAAQQALEALTRSTGAELERLRLELAFAANEKQASAVNLQDLSDERAQLADALRSIKAEMDQLVGESVRKAEALEREALALRGARDAAGDEMARLKAKLVEVDDDKQALRATVATLEADHTTQVSALEQRVAALSSENSALQRAAHALRLEHVAWLQQSATDAELQREPGAMHEAQARLALLVEELETRLATQRESGDADQALVAKLAAEIADYERAVAAQATAIEQLRAELVLNDEELAALRGRIDELECNEHDAESEESDVPADEPGVQRSELEAENAALVEQLRLLRASASEPSVEDAASLQCRLAALADEKAAVEGELDTVAAQRRELFEELSALESQLMDESQEKLRLTAAVDALEQRVRESGAGAELASELERAKHANAVLLNELETLTAAVERLEAANKHLQNQQQRPRASSESDGAEAEVDDVDALRQRLELEAELRATLELDVKSYEDTLQVVRTELRESSDSISELLEKLKAMERDLRELSAAKEQAERDAAAARELAQRAKEEQTELRFQSQERARAFEQQLQDAQRTLASQQEALASQQEALADAGGRAELEAASRLEKTMAGLQAQLVEARNALATQADDWQTRHADAEQHAARLARELEQRGDELARLRDEAAAARRACAELEQQGQALDARWRAKEAELSQQVAAELASARQASSELAAQNAALEAELRARDAQWRAKEQALSEQAAADMDSLREQYQEAQEELDAYQKYADDEIHKLRASLEAGDVEVELSRTRADELSAELEALGAERKALEAKLQELLSARDEAVDHLQDELRELTRKCAQAEAERVAAADRSRELKAAVETLEGEAYRQRDELEDLSESLRSAQLEATHYQRELADAQRGRAELEALAATQRQRIDKLEKVKMTTETLELFRKLKSDRAELQATVQRKDEAVAALRERLSELECAVQAAREAKETAVAECESALREREALTQQVAALAAEKKEIVAHKSGSVTYLEKENLELLVENRQLKKRLEGGSGGRLALEDAPDEDPSAAAASAVLANVKAPRSSAGGDKKPTSGFLLGSRVTEGDEEEEEEEDEEEEEARPARIGRATIEALMAPSQAADASVVVVAAVENVKDPRARRLKRATKCYLVKCAFSDRDSVRRVMRNADSVLLVPALSESGTRFSKRVIDAVQAEDVPRLVILSSILATNDFWRRRHHREDAAEAAAAPAASSDDLGYEAVEAHARSVLANCVSLRIPLLMESVMFCREEILFASRFVGCFDADTPVPCIAVADVGAAAARVLAKPTDKFSATYCLASAAVTCSPRDMEAAFSQALGKRVKYRHVADAHLVELLRDRGATPYVAQSMVRLKNYLEFGNAHRDVVTDEPEKDEPSSELVGATVEREREGDVETKRLQAARFGYTNDFQRLVGREMTTPAAWLAAHSKHFVRAPENETQLFVVGSGEGLFAEFERFLAWQVTSATAAPPATVGEAAIPTTSGGVTQGKVTFCAIKAVHKPAGASGEGSSRGSGGGVPQHQPQQRAGMADSYYCHVTGGEVSPLNQLLQQLTAADVVVYIPPLYLHPDERLEMTRVVVEAARKANAWGVVLVSSIFTGRSSGEQLNHLGQLEQLVERSGVPHVIVRLPLFMEYFTALSSADYAEVAEESLSEGTASGFGDPEPGDEEEEEQKPPAHALAAAESSFASSARLSGSQWNLLDRSLATSRLYLIAMADAVKALAAIAFTFPLHRGHTRTLYTECATVREVEAVLQANAYKHRPIDFAHVDALYEDPARAFWRLAYWTKEFTKELLECAVALSAHAAPIEMSMDFEEVTDLSIAKALEQDLLLCECGEELHPADRQLHRDTECPLREVLCPRPGCGVVFQASARTEHDRTECLPARHTRKLLQAKEDGDALVQCELCHDQRFPIRKRDLERHQRYQCVKRIVSCQFAEWGCAERFPEAERRSHETTACVVAKRRQQLAADAAHVNEQVECDWCQQAVKKRHLLDHQEDECSERERPCPNAASGCKEWVPVGQFDAHVRASCCVTLERDALAAKAREKNAPVECKECGETLKVRQLARHWRDECVSRVVSCKNAAHGCKARLRWRDRHLHEDFLALARDRSVLEFTTGGAAYVALPAATSDGKRDLAPPWTAEYFVRLLDADKEILDLLRMSLLHLETQLTSVREHQRWREKAAACKKKLKQLKQLSKQKKERGPDSDGGSASPGQTSSRQSKLTGAELSAAAKSLADDFSESEEGLLATQKAAALAKGWIQVLLAEALRIFRQQQLNEDAASDLRAAIAAQSAQLLDERPSLAELVPDADRDRLGDLAAWAASVIPNTSGDAVERQQKLAEQRKLLAKRAEWQELLATLSITESAVSPAGGEEATTTTAADTERLRRRYQRELGKVDARLALASDNTPAELLERRGRHVLASSARNALALVAGPQGLVTFFRGTREVPLDCALQRGRWHHVALSAGPRELSVFLDGELRSAKRGAFELPLGFLGAADGASSFQGLLQEVRYWRECRSAAQLRRFAHAVLPLGSFHTRWQLYDSAAARRRLGVPPTPSLRESSSCVVNQTLKLLAQRARDRESEPVSCRQRCGEAVLLRRLERHQRLECRLRLVACPEPGCAQLFRFADAATHAAERCERRMRREELVRRLRAREALESCALDCGLAFKQRFAERHYRAECRNRLVACPRRDCGETIVAKTLGAHVASDCRSAELARERALVQNGRQRLLEKQQLQLQLRGSDSVAKAAVLLTGE
ncbi:hypothetical protein PybrP1_009493 [[Pythium] brassicae (nom. inval.)]|nr:hypothetical protein PybrP1_009493 [[Pythium] brassicae (nom. inval.)]